MNKGQDEATQSCSSQVGQTASASHSQVGNSQAAKSKASPLHISKVGQERIKKTVLKEMALSDSDEEYKSSTQRSKHLRYELREYETEKKFSEDDDNSQMALAKFLQSRAKKYPILYSVYKHIGAVPATVTPCERIFSDSGVEITARRNRLGTEKVEALMFLKEKDELNFKKSFFLILFAVLLFFKIEIVISNCKTFK